MSPPTTPVHEPTYADILKDQLDAMDPDDDDDQCPPAYQSDPHGETDPDPHATGDHPAILTSCQL
jgi:hypothetical protein